MAANARQEVKEKLQAMTSLQLAVFALQIGVVFDDMPRDLEVAAMDIYFAGGTWETAAPQKDIEPKPKREYEVPRQDKPYQMMSWSNVISFLAGCVVGWFIVAPVLFG